MSSLIWPMSASVVAHISLQSLVSTYLDSLIYPEIIVTTFCILGYHICKCLDFFRSRLMPCHEITPPKKGILICLKRPLPLFSFKFASLYIQSTLPNVSAQSLPCWSNPAIKMSSTILDTFGILLSTLSIFFWNMSPVGAAPNGNLVYLYLPNGQENVLKYEDFI